MGVFARELKFHIDACQPRHPQAEGMVERAAQDLREVIGPREGHGCGLDLPPLPLGRMGRRLQQIARLPLQQRLIEFYAQLAEVAI